MSVRKSMPIVFALVMTSSFLVLIMSSDSEAKHHPPHRYGATPTSCTTINDCKPVPNMATRQCSGGACSILTCTPNWLDFDKIYADGCECFNPETIAAGCAMIGTPGYPYSTYASVNTTQDKPATKIGVLPVSGTDNWYLAPLVYNQQTYHPRVWLSAPSNIPIDGGVSPGLDPDIVFDIIQGACGNPVVGTNNANPSGSACTASPIPPNAIASKVVSWDTTEGTAPTPHVSPTPNYGNVYIHVYRTSAPTCNAYQLNISTN